MKEEKILFSVSKGETDDESVMNARIHGRDDAYKVAHAIVQLVKSLPALGELIIEVFQDEIFDEEKESIEMPDFDKILKDIK